MMTRARRRRRWSGLLLLCALIRLSGVPATVSASDSANVRHAAAGVQQGDQDFEFDYGAAQAAERAEERRRAWEAASEAVAALDEQTRTAAVVVDLETGETLLSHRASEGFVPASVYKLPIVFSILSSVEDGELGAKARIAGMSVRQCVESAIVRSENECMEAWIDTIGTKGAERAASRVGMRNTTFAPYNLRTNAGDVAAFLVNLYDGELLNEKNSQRMIELMKKQVWRDGMPAALEPEHVVADKVGFLPNVRTDAGIVYTEDGDYAVVILTESNKWSFVAAVAEAIGEAM